MLMVVAIAAKGQDSSAKSKNDTVYYWRLTEPFRYITVSNEDTPLKYGDYERRKMIVDSYLCRFYIVKKKKRLFKRKPKNNE